ncbi:MAG: hypothetical protein ACO3NL_13315 [Phycisphaerales bacterium]
MNLALQVRVVDGVPSDAAPHGSLNGVNHAPDRDRTESVRTP